MKTLLFTITMLSSTFVYANDAKCNHQASMGIHANTNPVMTASVQTTKGQDKGQTGIR